MPSPPFLSDLHFNPRPPRGGRRHYVSVAAGYPADFNPRPPRGGRRMDKNTDNFNALISIHAPREGGDDLPAPGMPKYREFQSTPPARGATALTLMRFSLDDISIHAPREGGDMMRLPLCALVLMIFQSTPPARGATVGKIVRDNSNKFQSTPPARGATAIWTTCGGGSLFQSTPPARGATGSSRCRRISTGHFNPRPPRGGRR